MASTKRNDFCYKEWLPLKEMASTKRNEFHWNEWFTLNGMVCTKSNGFHQNDCLPLKGMVFHYGKWFRQRRTPPKGIVSITGTCFHWNQWLSLEGMASVKSNGLQEKELLPLTGTFSKKDEFVWLIWMIATDVNFNL